MLKALGFVHFLVLSSQIFFDDASSYITNNVQQSHTFGLHRSIHQGCHLAPSLYIFVAK